MTLDQIRYFLAAAKFEHVGRAAKSIPISASVVSQAVKQLEEELNCQLFVREKKRIRLTAHGSRLLELSANLLRQADEISRELGKTNPPLSGHYRIGASHSLAIKVITPVIANMQARFPRLTVDLHSAPSWSLVDSILAGRLDFAVGYSPVPHPQLDTEQIFEGHSLIAVRKNHPIFSRAKKNTYKLLGDYPATMHMSTDKIFMARNYPFLREAKLDRNITFSFDSDYVAAENLRKSDHWALLVDIVVAEFQSELRIVPFPRQSESRYTIQIIKHKSKRMDNVLIEAYGLIKKEAARLKKPE